MSEIDALIELLQDEDPQIAIIAMEKLLHNPAFVNDHLKELQESTDPALRTRIHQMESIISRQVSINEFTQRIKENRIHLWHDLVFLNKLLDQELTSSAVKKSFKEIVSKLETPKLTTLELAAFMRENDFSAPAEDILDPGLYYISEVLSSGLGCPLILCVITEKIAQKFDKNLTIVLNKGRHCLVDEQNMFIDPQNGFSVTKLKLSAKVYPCTNRDILLTLIAQLYLAALVEGQLRMISFLSKIMTQLSNTTLEELPYPIGHTEFQGK